MRASQAQRSYAGLPEWGRPPQNGGLGFPSDFDAVSGEWKARRKRGPSAAVDDARGADKSLLVLQGPTRQGPVGTPADRRRRGLHRRRKQATPWTKRLDEAQAQAAR